MDRLPIPGWLKSSKHLKGNIGRVSDDLYKQLFHHQPILADRAGQIKYVAITLLSPLFRGLVEDVDWTILPVYAQEQDEAESDTAGGDAIYLPATSLALQTFAESIRHYTAARSDGKTKNGIEVTILDVEPLELDKIYVTVDGDALLRHDEVQKKFGGGFDHSRTNGHVGKGKGKARATSHTEIKGNGGTSSRHEEEDKLTKAVREALSMVEVVRQHDMLPLPLPAHPITHVPPPPAQISLCEPLSQGILSDATKIVVSRRTHEDDVNRGLRNAAQRTMQGLVMEDGDETSTEQFFSAAENNTNGRSTGSGVDESSESESADDGSSDASMDDIISMDAPRLPSHRSGVSSPTDATPRARGSIVNGIRTPGSVYSILTSTTARQGPKAKARLFRARGLLRRIPDDILHPRPAADEDDEARVFTDIRSLVRLGCFSGDWVKLAVIPNSSDGRAGLWDVDAFDSHDSLSSFRPVKIYGLSDLSPSTENRYLVGSASDRRLSMFNTVESDSLEPELWLSPVLLANLGQQHYVKLAPLGEELPNSGGIQSTHKAPKFQGSSSPPVAKEMTLLRISTPVSTERALQTGIFTSLKQHFESKRRILQQNDMIALPVDVSVSRLLAQAAGASDAENELEEVFSLHLDTHASRTTNLDIAWFRVGQVTISDTDEFPQPPSAETWGGAACIEPMVTRMRQAGSESSNIPSALDSPWQSYLETKPPSRSFNSRRPLSRYATSMVKAYITPLRRRLRELLSAASSPRAIHLGMDPVVALLYSTQRNIGKATLATSAASDLGMHVFDIDACDIVSEAGKAEALFKARAERALSCGPACTAIMVRHIENLTADPMITALKEVLSDVRVMIATTTKIDDLPDGVRSLFTHELEVTAPDEGEREGTLKAIVEDRAIRIAHDVDLASIAVKSAALVAGDLVDIVERALVARQNRIVGLMSRGSSRHTHPSQRNVRDVLVSGGESARCVTKADFDIAVEAARKNFADAIGAPKIPNVSWDDVGGLENVKDAVMETIQLPLERPELFAKGMKKRSGILFYGPPGTGKTLLAKAIATEFSLNFFSVKGPELLNMYIGESEANVRRVFQRARDARPCVVFFDELDSVAPKRGNQGDSGGVMDRIVSQLLAELDGMSDGDEGGGGVFVIGATNRPDLLDQALLRPGRFDKMLYLGVSDTHNKQLTVMEALTRKFSMHPEMSLRRVAESLPFTYTGADLYALCSDAMLKAITRQSSAVDAKIKALPGGPVTTAYFFQNLASKEDIAVVVTEEDFFTAQKELVGSVRYVIAFPLLLDQRLY